MTEYFTRYGKPFPVTPREATLSNGRKSFGAHIERSCSRCGGAGGADKWKHTGWTCYRCGGKCVDPIRLWEVAYTADKLAKLNAANAKRAETRQRKLDAKRAEQEAAADARRAEFMESHNDWISEARKAAGHVEFVADILAKAERGAQISAGQIEAVNKAVARERAEAEYKAQARYLGAPGDKITVEGRVLWSDARQGDFGWSYFYFIKTPQGLVSFRGSTSLGRNDDVVRFVATVKACEQSKRDGSPLTVVARPRKWELVEEGKYRRADREEKEREATEQYMRGVRERVRTATIDAHQQGRPYSHTETRVTYFEGRRIKPDEYTLTVP